MSVADIPKKYGTLKYLASGRLRRIFPDFALPSSYLYCPSKRNLPTRVSAFIDCLVENLVVEAYG